MLSLQLQRDSAPTGQSGERDTFAARSKYNQFMINVPDSAACSAVRTVCMSSASLLNSKPVPTTLYVFGGKHYQGKMWGKQEFREVISGLWTQLRERSSPYTLAQNPNLKT